MLKYPSCLVVRDPGSDRHGPLIKVVFDGLWISKNERGLKSCTSLLAASVLVLDKKAYIFAP